LPVAPGRKGVSVTNADEALQFQVAGGIHCLSILDFGRSKAPRKGKNTCLIGKTLSQQKNKSRSVSNDPERRQNGNHRTGRRIPTLKGRASLVGPTPKKKKGRPMKAGLRKPWDVESVKAQAMRTEDRGHLLGLPRYPPRGKIKKRSRGAGLKPRENARFLSRQSERTTGKGSGKRKEKEESNVGWYRPSFKKEERGKDKGNPVA